MEDKVVFREEGGSPVTNWPSLRQEFTQHLPNDARVADVGSGLGLDSKFFRDIGIDVLSVDSDFQALDLQTLGERVQADVNNLPLADNSFDGIWFANLLIFIDGDLGKEQVIAKLFRLLKPGGVLFLCTNVVRHTNPLIEKVLMRSKDRRDSIHFSPTVELMLVKAGFEILRSESNVTIPSKQGFTKEDGTFLIIFAKKPEEA